VAFRLFIIFLSFFPAVFSYAQSYEGWKYVGPQKTAEEVKGYVKALWADESNLNMVLAGSANGGLFKTENALSAQPQWTNITDSYGAFMTYGVSDIAVRPNTGASEMYIATSSRNGLAIGYGEGILKTTDGGKSWNHVGPGAAGDYTMALDGLVMSRDNADEMIAWSFKEVFITRDAWKSWEKIDVPVDKNNANINICDIEFAPFEAGKFYICTKTYNFYDARIFVYENYGREVKDITPKDVSSERMEVATVYDKKYRGKFYLGGGTKSLFVKYFDGKNFSAVLNAPLSHWFSNAYWCLELAVNQIDTNIVYIASTEVSRSTNGGRNFALIGNYNGKNIHADQRSMLLAKSSAEGKNDVLLMGNDGGVSMNEGLPPMAWKNLDGTGLDNNLIWGVSVAQSDSLFVAAGAADNGGFMISRKETVNTIGGCGDGYGSVAIDDHSAIIECNTPSMFYHNLKTGKTFGMVVGEDRYEVRRPLLIRDSMIYTGFGNVWGISKRMLENGINRFEKISDLPVYKRSEGQVQNNSMRALAIGKFNSGVMSFANPNWGDRNKTGKLFFTRNINKKEWIDISRWPKVDNLELCQWAEITNVVMDARDRDKFYILSRDINNQLTNFFCVMQYFPASDSCSVKSIVTGMPKIGLNHLKIDEQSNILYLSADNGVWWTDLNEDSLTWDLLNGNVNRFPGVMVIESDINYATNELYVATFGRGIWKTRLVSSGKNAVNITRNGSIDEPLKVDGKMTLSRKTVFTVNNKLIITSGSKIELKKGSILRIRNRSLVRNEKNEPLDLMSFPGRSGTGKIIFGPFTK
jgi:hypothetical protein